MPSEQEQFSEQQTSSEDEETTQCILEQRAALRRYREIMYKKQKEAISSSVQAELKEYFKYLPFEITKHIAVFEDDSEYSNIYQDFDILEIN